MTCEANTSTLLACIQRVCRAANSHAAAVGRVRDAAQSLETALAASESALTCVLNGGASTTCDLPLGGTLQTLAGALAGLNAASISAIAAEETTASASQTTWTLSAAPTGAAYLQVAVNGATLDPDDWSLSGAEITLDDPLDAGDELAAWSYQL